MARYLYCKKSNITKSVVFQFGFSGRATTKCICIANHFIIEGCFIHAIDG